MAGGRHPDQIDQALLSWPAPPPAWASARAGTGPRQAHRRGRVRRRRAGGHAGHRARAPPGPTAPAPRDVAPLVADYDAELLLLGLPIDLAGKEGPAAVDVRAERDELAAVVGVPVEVHDERLTTRIADRALRERGDLDGRARRKVVDMVAAAVILQDWLDHHATPAPAEEPEP
ncbi:MAG: Holliday junction resolvase RuvX [Acidimicrobiales bacterium]